MSKRTESWNTGINASDDLDVSIKGKILSITAYLTVNRNVLKKLIPDVPGTRAAICFKLLIFIHTHPRSSLSNIKGLLKNNSGSNERNIQYLVALGYLKEIGKPRLIIPFQAYKIDRGYVITSSGELVLKKLLEGNS